MVPGYYWGRCLGPFGSFGPWEPIELRIYQKRLMVFAIGMQTAFPLAAWKIGPQLEKAAE